MVQIKVPKFIDIEDKIVFGLTWRQFLYLGLGLGFGTVFFQLFTPAVGFPFALMSIGAGAAFAFLKPYGRPFKAFFLSLWRYNFKPRRYFWTKERSQPQAIREAPQPKAISAVEAPRTKLEDIARALDIHQRLRAAPPPLRPEDVLEVSRRDVEAADVIHDYGEIDLSKRGLIFPTFRKKST